MILAQIAPWAMLISGIPLAGLTLYAFGWREPGNDTRASIPASPSLVAPPAHADNSGVGDRAA